MMRWSRFHIVSLSLLLIGSLLLSRAEEGEFDEDEEDVRQIVTSTLSYH